MLEKAAGNEATAKAERWFLNTTEIHIYKLYIVVKSL